MTAPLAPMSIHGHHAAKNALAARVPTSTTRQRDTGYLSNQYLK